MIDSYRVLGCMPTVSSTLMDYKVVHTSPGMWGLANPSIIGTVLVLG